MLNEDLSSAQKLQLKRFTNNFTLIGQLFNSKFYDFEYMDSVLKIQFESKSEDRLYCALKAFSVCADRFYQGPKDRVDEAVQQLQTIAKSVSKRLQFLIEDVLELRRKVPAVKTGPSNVSQIPSNVSLGPTSRESNTKGGYKINTTTKFLNRAPSNTTAAPKNNAPKGLSKEEVSEFIKQIKGDIKDGINPHVIFFNIFTQL